MTYTGLMPLNIIWTSDASALTHQLPKLIYNILQSKWTDADEKFLHESQENVKRDFIGRGHTLYVAFLAVQKLVKKQKNEKSFYGCNIQVSVQLSLKFLGQSICQRRDSPSSTLPVFSLGHNMGRFAPFALGSTQLLHL